MPRLFVALLPPEEVLDVLAALPRPEVPGLRWTNRDQWHVTVRFLGRVESAEPVAAALGAVAWPARPVEARVGPAVGRFGDRVLQAPVTGLEVIAERVVAATAHLGQPAEERPFAGHVTLARAGRGPRPRLSQLTGEPVSASWVVEEVCLMESHLSPRGARYEVVEAFPVWRGDMFGRLPM